MLSACLSLTAVGSRVAAYTCSKATPIQLRARILFAELQRNLNNMRVRRFIPTGAPLSTRSDPET
jgi:hypothetical protein